jgi:Zn-dependent protease
LKHLDPWGSVVVPFLLVMLFGFPFGWAKPVPYNPYNLRDQKIGPALVGLAGPLSNIIVALIFGLGARFLAVNFVMKREIIFNLFTMDYASLAYSISGSLAAVFFLIFSMIALINIFLAFFNLIPIPPLDGSKLLFAFLSLKTETTIMLEQFGFVILMFVIFFMSGPIGMFLSLVRNIFFTYVVGIS